MANEEDRLHVPVDISSVFTKLYKLEAENKRLREIAKRMDKRLGFYFEKDKIFLTRLVNLYHTTNEEEKEKKLLSLIDFALYRDSIN